jgi:hypothetical protein
MKFTFVSACGKMEGQKYILSLRLKLVKVGGYYFPHLCDGPRNSHLFFKRSSIDTESDVLGEVRPCSLYFQPVISIRPTDILRISKY